jgi:hypothetical protein
LLCFVLGCAEAYHQESGSGGAEWGLSLEMLQNMWRLQGRGGSLSSASLREGIKAMKPKGLCCVVLIFGPVC